MNCDIYFIVALRQSDLHPFPAVILEDFASTPTVTNALNTRGNIMKMKNHTSAKYKY